MLCYKDTTFCTAVMCMRKDKCDRYLTKKIKQQAQQWWGESNGNAPIMLFTSPTALACYKVDKNANKNKIPNE